MECFRSLFGRYFERALGIAYLVQCKPETPVVSSDWCRHHAGVSKQLTTGRILVEQSDGRVFHPAVEYMSDTSVDKGPSCGAQRLKSRRGSPGDRVRSLPLLIASTSYKQVSFGLLQLYRACGWGGESLLARVNLWNIELAPVFERHPFMSGYIHCVFFSKPLGRAEGGTVGVGRNKEDNPADLYPPTGSIFSP